MGLLVQVTWLLAGPGYHRYPHMRSAHPAQEGCWDSAEGSTLSRAVEPSECHPCCPLLPVSSVKFLLTDARGSPKAETEWSDPITLRQGSLECQGFLHHQGAHRPPWATCSPSAFIRSLCARGAGALETVEVRPSTN